MKTPNLYLRGLKMLTDEVGMFQHTKFSTISRKEGYTTDDNARALIASIKYYENFGNPECLKLAEIYLSFLLHMQREDGLFHNLMGFDRGFKDTVGSEDCIGHALWACGYALSSNISKEMRLVAKEMFDVCLPYSRSFTSPRAKAFTILGLHNYQKAFPQDENLLVNIEEISKSLINQYNIESDEKWRWFEAYLTYANARLPQSLLVAYLSTKAPEYQKIAIESLDFLTLNNMRDDVFTPIGNNGWYLKGNKKALYDQQPIEASCMVDASVLAFLITGEHVYKKTAITAFDWFFGKNSKNVILIDAETGTCYDGITPDGLNRNQGAESTISYYLAYLTMFENELI
jgi:hypothetical protein